MKNGWIVLGIGTIFLCVGAVGTIVYYQKKKTKRAKTYDSLEKNSVVTTKDIVVQNDIEDSSTSKMDDLIEKEKDVVEQVKTRHEKAAKYVKEAIIEINDEEDEEEYEVDPIHEKLKNMIDEL